MAHYYTGSELNWLNLYEELKRIARNHFMQSEDYVVWTIEETSNITNNRNRNTIPLVNRLGHCTFTITYILSPEIDERQLLQEFSVEYDHTQGVRARSLREPEVEYPLHIPCFAHNVALHFVRFLEEISLYDVHAWNQYVVEAQDEEIRKRNLALVMSTHDRLGTGTVGFLREILKVSGGLYRFLISPQSHY